MYRLLAENRQRLLRPYRLEAKDTALSRRQHGFESRWGHLPPALPSFPRVRTAQRSQTPQASAIPLGSSPFTVIPGSNRAALADATGVCHPVGVILHQHCHRFHGFEPRSISRRHRRLLSRWGHLPLQSSRVRTAQRSQTPQASAIPLGSSPLMGRNDRKRCSPHR